jgi:hypothetical protein
MLDNWRLLTAAVLRRAYLDARRGDGDAIAWLEDEGAAWLDALGYNGDAILFTVLKF